MSRVGNVKWISVNSNVLINFDKFGYMFHVFSFCLEYPVAIDEFVIYHLSRVIRKRYLTTLKKQ